MTGLLSQMPWSDDPWNLRILSQTEICHPLYYPQGFLHHLLTTSNLPHNIHIPSKRAPRGYLILNLHQINPILCP